MATVIEHDHTSSGNGAGLLVGLLLLVILAVLFFIYGLPYLGRTMSGPQINVPGQIDVNVQNPK